MKMHDFALLKKHQRHKIRLYQNIEAIGRQEAIGSPDNHRDAILHQ
jgi:hypothetical protein